MNILGLGTLRKKHSHMNTAVDSGDLISFTTLEYVVYTEGLIWEVTYMADR